MEQPLYNQKGKKEGAISLPEGVFNLPWNADLVHQVVTVMQSNKRSGAAHTKNRGDVSGGGKKPWKQKGTGRARHGSIRSPLWRGGGTTFGPRNEKNYTRRVTKNMRVKALLTILSQKVRDEEVLFLHSMSFPKPKTVEAISLLKTLEKGSDLRLISKKRNATLITLVDANESVRKSFSNLGNIMVDEMRNINPLSLLQSKYLIITDPEHTIQLLQAKTKNK